MICNNPASHSCAMIKTRLSTAGTGYFVSREGREGAKSAKGLEQLSRRAYFQMAIKFAQACLF